MMASSRHIKRLYIDRGIDICWWKLNDPEDKRLRQLVKRIGFDVKELTMTGVQISTKFIHVFELMPNLEKITFSKVHDHYENNGVVLNLPKLKEIICTTSSRYEVLFLEMFNNLPPGILRKLRFMMTQMTQIYSPTFGPIKILFENQHNIEDIEIHGLMTDFLNFKKFKLNTLKLQHSCGIELAKIIKGQQEMKKFDSDYGIQSGDLKMICNELKSLEYLKISAFEVEDNEFTYLWRLKKLKKLNFNLNYFTGNDDHLNECLSLAESESIQELDLDCDNKTLTGFTLTHLGINMPSLKHFRLRSKSGISELNSIVQHFQNLESLEFSTRDDENDRFRLQDLVPNGKLRKICLPSQFQVDEYFAKLVGCCAQLKEITISCCINAPQTARQILMAGPNLKSLSMVSDTFISLDLVESLADHGTNLDKFVCKQPLKQPFWFIFDHEYFDDMNKKIKQKFQNQFRNISFDEDKWVMTNEEK